MAEGGPVVFRGASDRFRTEADGIETWHSFSFGQHYDPERIGFGPIVAINEERLEPGAGYDAHRHSDIDIVTRVVSGELAHEDTTGTAGVVRPGELQLLRAGSGVEHAERNASSTEPLVFVQMLLRSTREGAPSYQRTALPVLCVDDNVLVVAVGRQSLPPAERVLVHVVKGVVRAANQVLRAGDELHYDGALPLVSCSDNSEALVWLLGANVKVLDGHVAGDLDQLMVELHRSFPVGTRRPRSRGEYERKVEKFAASLTEHVALLVVRPDLVLRDADEEVQRWLEDVLNIAVARSRGRFHVRSIALRPSEAIRASWR